MHRFFSLLTCLIGFVVKITASDFIEENEILQIEKHPEVIKYVEEDKIYLNPDFLKISEESIILESFDGPILLSNLNADLNGCYVMNVNIRRWKDYYRCLRCDVKFEKKLFLQCPICGKNDLLIFLYSKFE
jgi:hypothetical protein